MEKRKLDLIFSLNIEVFLALDQLHYHFNLPKPNIQMKI